LPNVAYIAGLLIEQSKERGENFYKMMKDRYKTYIENKVLADYDKETDKEIFAALIDFYVNNVDEKFISPELKKALKGKTAAQLANELYNQSGLTSKKGLETLFGKETSEAYKQTLEQDPAYRLLNEQQNWIDEKVSTPVAKINEEISDLMRRYMKAQMLVFPDKLFYPDANFTMRVAYGKIKGFEPRDGVFYKPFTHLYGAIEKYKPNDPEFDLPQKFIELFEKKDYGRYANKKDGTLVTDFLATNHITGGNSGSPILNARGEHIGLAFDGVWEGVMEDVYYRPEIARSIHVTDHYVLFIIDKFAHCNHIMNELTIVQSGNTKPHKKNNKKKKRKKFLGIF
jgi:hypothetical protein